MNPWVTLSENTLVTLINRHGFTFRAAIGIAASALPSLLRRLLSRARGDGGGGTHAVRDGATIRLPQTDLTNVVSACLRAAGATEAHAAMSAESLVYADTRGIPSHGVNRAEFYAAELAAGLINGAASPTVTRDDGCCALVDGNNALGAVVSTRAVELAFSKAREFGVGWVVCPGSNHCGAAGFWAEKALACGMIGFSFTNTAPFMGMVPTGAYWREHARRGDRPHLLLRAGG